MLYQEADGIPKLKWILVFRAHLKKSGVTHDLINYYKRLTDTMQRL